jgi:peptidoglycan-associated lipoprotein
MQARRSIHHAARGGAVLALAILAGCGYAKRKDVDAQFATLRDEMQTAHTQIDERASQLDGRVNGLEGRLTAVESDLQSLRTEFNAKIEELEGKLAFNLPVNFEYDKADVRPEDQESLNRFAAVVKDHYPGAIVTIEGFADPAGSTSYNRRLGMRRAEAVKEYLVQQGLLADKVKTVSYGESQDRLVNDGRGPEAGVENRRVSLVIDYAEHGQTGQRVITD